MRWVGWVGLACKNTYEMARWRVVGNVDVLLEIFFVMVLMLGMVGNEDCNIPFGLVLFLVMLLLRFFIC